MKSAEKAQARILRSQGCSIKEISEQLHVARGSVSIWVRDIPLTAEQVERLTAKIVRSQQRLTYLNRCGGANKNRDDAIRRHTAFRAAGYERAKRDDGFRIVCALYWGEGRKTGGIFEICNSDPRLLRVISSWLIRSGFDDVLRFSVRYHPANGLSEETIRNWWLAQLPELKPAHVRQFTQCGSHRASQQKLVGKLPYGTGVVGVCRTELFFNVLGGIDYLSKANAGD